MQVNLRKARQIEALLNKHYNTDIECSLQYSIYGKLTVDILDISIESGIEEFDDAIDELRNINASIFEIRSLIPHANETSGINSYIAERAKYKNFLTRLNQFKYVQPIQKTDEIFSKIEAKLSGVGINSMRTNDDEVTISKCSRDQLGIIKQDIADCKQIIVNMDDAILEQNVATKIVLSEEIVRLLRQLSIPF